MDANSLIHSLLQASIHASNNHYKSIFLPKFFENKLVRPGFKLRSHRSRANELDRSAMGPASSNGFLYFRFFDHFFGPLVFYLFGPLDSIYCTSSIWTSKNDFAQFYVTLTIVPKVRTNLSLYLYPNGNLE